MPESPIQPSRKRRDLIRFLLIIGVLLLFNFVGQRLFFRLDLTEEKRYTMSPATKQLLQNLPEPVTVTVYLDGEFPPAFRRLQQAVRETLNEMQVYGGQICATYSSILRLPTLRRHAASIMKR
ncbi:Gldg family protein [Hymenobacter sp. HDW8]|uniref:DUF7088 domain-containing protein n=1 Tax=Hymenobacter sp. HDW8 TaxID=2714932 RepID=UPI0021D04804|nr:Gldg family protein [Hymenobacter sp. HDW8]